MDEIINQMKGIQGRISNQINSNSSVESKIEIIGGDGIDVKSDQGKFSISAKSQISDSGFRLPQGTGVLGIDNGVLIVYEIAEC